MRTRRTILILAVLGLQACSSTYVGYKLPPDGEQPKGDTGVPYTLTRHEFTLRIAPDPEDSTKSVYTLTRISVPDPHQRYSLALSPGFLTDGTMTYSFGALGNLGNAEASTTSQVVATIKAVAGIAVNVIGAKTALRDEADVWTRFKAELARPEVCKNGSGAALAVYEGELDAAAKKKFPEADKGAADKAKAERAVLNKRAAFVADRFHYRTPAEKTCLAAVQAAFGQDELTTENDAYNLAIKEAEKVSANSEAIKDLKGLVNARSDPDTVAAKLSVLDGKADAMLRTAYEKAQAYLTSVQNNKLAAKLALFYVDMPLDVWRARHLVQVEANLDKARFALQVLLANPPGTGASNDVKQQFSKDVQRAQGQLKLQVEQRDQLVDANDLKRRIAAIDVLLNSGKTGDDGGRAQISADRDRLQALWDQDRANLLTKNQTFDMGQKPKTLKIEAKDDEPVTLVDESYVTGVNGGSVAIDPKRKFVVVMRLLPSPTPMKAPTFTPAAGK